MRLKITTNIARGGTGRILEAGRRGDVGGRGVVCREKAGNESEPETRKMGGAKAVSFWKSRGMNADD